MNLVLCRTIQVSLTYENLKIELSLEEPYQWILKDDQAYILEDPQEEASFRSDIFVDSIGSILATILRLENGGDFARILRCESNGDRIKLLRRIVGETALPDIEELKKEFAQADRQPIVIYPHKKESSQKPKPTEPITEKKEEKPTNVGEPPTKPESTPKEMTITKEVHHPVETARRQIVIREKAKVTTESVKTYRRIADGNICEEKALLFEETEKRYPIRVSHIQGYEGPKCDIISFQTETDWQKYKGNPNSDLSLIKRFIEVKGRSSERGLIPLKGNELDAARIYADRYYLYRLYEKSSSENILLILNDPLEQKEALDNIIEVDLARALGTERYQLNFAESSEAIANDNN